MSLRAAVALLLTAALASIPAVGGGAPDSGDGVRLRSGLVTAPAPGAPREIAQGDPVVLRLLAPLGRELRQELKALGVHLEAPLGRDGFLARLDGASAATVEALPGVRWIAPLEPRSRVAPALRERLRFADDGTAPVTLHLFTDADAELVAGRIRAAGLVVAGSSKGRPRAGEKAARPGRIVVRLPGDRVEDFVTAASGWPEVLWLDRRPDYRLLNDASAWVLQSGLGGNGATPIYDQGILGNGQTVAVLDTGLDADMCFFRDDTLGLPPVVHGTGVGTPDPAQRKVTVVDFLWSGDAAAGPNDWDTQDHGSHVAGSVAGDDATTPGSRDAGDGMAPAAKLVIQDGGFGTDDCADLPAIGCPAADLYPFFEQAYLQGARIHSNSYGDRENFTPYNIYSDGSEAADAVMWDHPDYLLFFAAGNNGPGSATVASPATAKNVVAVGATGHGSGAGSLASFSSQGPTADGRIKPDVTAPGSAVISADNDGDIGTDNCGTRSTSGTSMACPTAAGFAALVREYFESGFYPGGQAAPGDALLPTGALVKAALIASAVPMEGVGAAPPSDTQGWGRILLDNVLFFPGDERRLYVADGGAGFAFPADPVQEHLLEVIDPSLPLRVVLTWTDYPSTPAAATNLVNDLDLELVSPGGTLYRGNVFSGGVSQPGGGADTLNNVEVVHVESPESGSWIARVRPSAIPEPAQAYALVATGRLPVSGVYLDRSGLVADDAVGGDGDGTLEPGEWIDLGITLLNSGDTAAGNVTVELTGASAGVEVFSSTAPLGLLAPGADLTTAPGAPRIRLDPALACAGSIELELTYTADGFSRSETLSLPTGHEDTITGDDFEGATSWLHIPGESTAGTGDWLVGDPVGTGFQPEEDATPGAGVACLYTGANPTGSDATDDVDGGVVVARSGAYDLSGHPEARLRIARWFANRDLGEDSGDFFTLEIREDGLAPSVLLERLPTTVSAARWSSLDFRVADFVTPGPGVNLRVAAADGTATGNIIEAAIDDVLFWEPRCEVYDPAPGPILGLAVNHDGNDVQLGWGEPPVEPTHGASALYRVYRGSTPSGGFAEIAVTAAGAPAHADANAVAVGALRFYQVIAENGAGSSESLP